MSARRTIALAAAAALLACAGPSRVDSAQRALARELVRRRDWPRAFAVADALCRQRPDAEAYYLRGVVYREQRLDAEAEADLLQAVRADPKHAGAHGAVAILYDLQGRADAALEHHRRAAALAPRDPALLNNLAFSLLVHGRPKEAIEGFREALRLSPTDARIRNNLGLAYAAAGDLTQAAAQFALGGTPAQAKNNLGWAYERRGDAQRAFDLYVDAIRADPVAPGPRENLERVGRALGRAAPTDLPPPTEEASR